MEEAIGGEFHGAVKEAKDSCIQLVDHLVGGLEEVAPGTVAGWAAGKKWRREDGTEVMV